MTQTCRPGPLVRYLALAVAAGSLVGCSGGSGDPGSDSGMPGPDATSPDAGDSGQADGGTARRCDPLVPSYCAYPFPSTFWTEPDSSTSTGLRVALSEAAMPAGRMEPEPYNRADGFSPSAAALAHLPGASAEGLPGPRSIGRSLEPSSPTVLIHADSGERVAHFSELDVQPPDHQKALMVRPAAGLEPGARYVVAIRDVVNEDGEPIAASEAFAALRDGADTDLPTVQARRARYEDEVFSVLEEAGVERESLQLAWDFTVASREGTTADMLHVRDDALETVGPQGAEYELDDVERNPEGFEGMALKVEGRIHVPLYLESTDPGALLARGADGRPEQNGTGAYEFWMLVPDSAATEPAGIVQYGHGMLGSGRAVFYDDAMQRFARDNNYAVFGMDWIGFSVRDMGVLVEVLASGEMHDFEFVPEGLHQGLVNFLVGMRTVRGGIANDPAIEIDGASPLDPSRAFYYGGSQGGIFGATYMALSTTVERGVLAVPGQSYGLMLARSVNFDPFHSLLMPHFRDGLDLPMVIQLTQMLWDRAEPSGYSRYIRDDTFADTPSHDVLMLVSIGDHQVTTLAAHMLARTIGGVVNVGPLNREVFGLDVVDEPHTGSAMIEHDFGVPEPLENVPATEGEDPHSRIAEVDAAFQTTARFYADGVIQSFCDGPCDPD